MLNDRLKTAVIGLGVGHQHAKGYAADPRCELVALCDIDPEKLGAVASEFPGAATTGDPNDILRDPSIHAVSIASYDDAHFPQIMQALAHGKHVFAEKPICLHEEDLNSLYQELKARPTQRFSSNLVLRKVPRFIDLRQRIRQGVMGDLYYLEGDYQYGRMHKITEGWRGRIPFYSVVHGGAIHLIDLLMWMAAFRPIEATAMGTAIASRGTAFRFNDCVVGLLRDSADRIAKVSSNYSSVTPHYHSLAVYGTAESFIQSPTGAARYEKGDQSVLSTLIETPYRSVAKDSMIASFVTSIVDGGEPDVSAQEVLDAMSVSIAIEHSVSLGKPHRIDYYDLHRSNSEE
ncbi:Gfo/Idh/MocA family protein [Magnetospira sp. QH-2]|uniref:Gfo/Idh/MocA family protein n=1 Tax=Magnetospira sp. (strain QH-2) TaxID=1288970 RepID=UPI0003E81876|nr:Gfo/Idh/MocA family oxidoreductase [Magnetospira sp. QH-2]CCQ73085.1 conserved protein of unknown function [Magnetospira sp. QH-2]